MNLKKRSFQSSLNFNGTTKIQIPKLGVTSNNTVHSSFTIESWIKLNQLNKWQTIYQLGGYANGIALGITNTNKLRLAIQGSFAGFVDSDDTIPIGKWVHVAGVLGNNSLSIYINGKLVKKDNGHNNFSVGTNSHHIGSQNTQSALDGISASNYTFSGNMQDFRIWNTARTEEQVFENMKTVQGNEQGLILNWLFDDRTGLIAVSNVNTIESSDLNINNLNWSNDFVEYATTKILILHDGMYKKYDVINGWSVVDSSVIDTDLFLENGIDSLSPLLDRDMNGVSPIDELNNGFQIITWTDKDIDFYRAVTERQALPKPQLVYPTGDISISGVSSIDKLTLLSTGDVKITISFDSGLTEQVFRNGLWSTVDNAHSGMTNSEINMLTSEQINLARNGSNYIRFNYSLSNNDEVDNIKMEVSLMGYEKLADSSSYELKYDQVTNKIIYNIKRDGNFSVNYVDA